MKNQDYIDELLGRYFAQEELTDEQQKDLEDWKKTNPEEFSRLERFLKQADEVLRDKQVFDAGKAWEQVAPKLSERRQIRLVPHVWITAVAAVLVLAWFGLKAFWFGGQSDLLRYENQTARIATYLLPDSSEVMLFPGASVSCQIAQNEGERRVNLAGKAFFRVHRDVDRKFRVKAGDVAVEVLGTSFLVDASSVRETAVQVKSGRVRVSSGEANVELTVNEQVRVSGRSLKKNLISDPEETFGFVDLVLVFRDESVFQIVQKIERTSGIQIVLGPGVGENQITTRLDLNQIQTVIEELAYLCKCRYEQTDSLHYRLYYEQDE